MLENGKRHLKVVEHKGKKAIEVYRRDPEDPIPIALLLGIAVSGAMGLGSVIQSLIGDPTSAAINAGKWEVMKALGGLDSIMEVYDGVTDAYPNILSGIELSEISDMLDEIIRGTIWMKAALPAEISSRLYMSMLDWSLSQAMQTSLGGTIQNTYNVYRGAANPMPSEVLRIWGDRELLDEKVQAVVTAASGANIPYSLIQMMRGAKQRIMDKTSNAEQTILTLLRERSDVNVRMLREIEEMAFSYVREQYLAVATVIRSAYSTGITTLSYYLTRVQQQFDQLEASRTYYENETWDLDRFKLNIAEVETQVALIDSLYADRVQDIIDAADEVIDAMTFDTSPLTTVFEYRDELTRNAMTQYWEVLNETVGEEKIFLQDQMSKLRAYRMLIPPDSPPEEGFVDIEGYVGETPEKPPGAYTFISTYANA